jgi:NAD(P)-dependent dehydrogenase (short-subunit alcohol dehydrogenase family)
MSASKWTEADVPDQTGRVAIVTGSNTGLGFDTARVLAEHGARVVLAVRDTEKGKAAKDRILKTAPHADVSIQPLDLGSLQSVRAAVEDLRAAYPRIDLLINNAGVMVPPKQVTPDGFELQFGTNYLGHFALTGLLLDNLMPVDGSRIVVVSSNAHKFGGAIHFDDLQWERRYNRGAAYAQSKLANLMFGYELQRRLTEAGSPVRSLAAHPGYAATNLQSHTENIQGRLMELVSPLVGQSPDQGALPQLCAATCPQLVGGVFLGPSGPGEMRGAPRPVGSSRASHSAPVQRGLWSASAELTGVRYEFGAPAR